MEIVTRQHALEEVLSMARDVIDANHARCEGGSLHDLMSSRLHGSLAELEQAVSALDADERNALAADINAAIEALQTDVESRTLEVERLRTAIEAAPCPITQDGSTGPCKRVGCVCWKRRALAPDEPGEQR